MTKSPPHTLYLSIIPNNLDIRNDVITPHKLLLGFKMGEASVVEREREASQVERERRVSREREGQGRRLYKSFLFNLRSSYILGIGLNPTLSPSPLSTFYSLSSRYVFSLYHKIFLSRILVRYPLRSPCFSFDFIDPFEDDRARWFNDNHFKCNFNAGL